MNSLRTEDAYERYLVWKRARRKTDPNGTRASARQCIDFHDSVRALKELSRRLKRKETGDTQNSESHLKKADFALPGKCELVVSRASSTFFSAENRSSCLDV